LRLAGVTGESDRVGIGTAGRPSFSALTIGAARLGRGFLAASFLILLILLGLLGVGVGVGFRLSRVCEGASWWFRSFLRYGGDSRTGRSLRACPPVGSGEDVFALDALLLLKP